MRGQLTFVAASAVLVGAMLLLPEGAPFSIDAGAKELQALAFAHDSGWPRPIEVPAQGLDPDGRLLPPFLVPMPGGAASIYPVLFPLLAAPLAGVAGPPALRLLPLAAGVAAAWLAGLLVRRLCGVGSPGPPAAAALLATPLAFYALTFWEQTLAATLVMAALLVILGSDDRRPVRPPAAWAGGGLLLGTACWVRTEIVVLTALVVAVPLVMERRSGLRAALAGAGGAAAGLLLGAGLQRLALGSWLPLHLVYHAESFTRGGSLLQERLATLVGSMVPDPVTALASLIWIAALAAALWDRTRRSRLTRTLGVSAVLTAFAAALAAPALRWMAGARPTEAFPFAAPAATWVLLAPLPLAAAARPERIADRRWRAMALVAALFVVAVSLAKPARSPEWGHRLLLPSVLLGMVVLLALEPFSARAPKVIRRTAVAALAVALVVQAGGLALLGHGVATHAGLVRSLLSQTSPGDVVLTDTAMLPLGSAAGFASRRFLFCASPDALDYALRRLAAAGERSLSFATVDGLAFGGLRPGELLSAGEARWRRVAREVHATGRLRLVLDRYEGEEAPP